MSCTIETTEMIRRFSRSAHESVIPFIWLTNGGGCAIFADSFGRSALGVGHLQQWSGLFGRNVLNRKKHMHLLVHTFMISKQTSENSCKSLQKPASGVADPDMASTDKKEEDRTNT